MRPNPWWIFVALLLSFECGAATESSPSSMTLSEAVHYALAHSPEVSARRSERQARELELRNANSVFLPSLDLEAVHGLQESVPSFGTSNTVGRLRLSLSENLFDNGVDWVRQRKARLTLERATLNLQEEENRVAFEAAAAFLDFSAATRSLAVQREQHDLLLKQFKIVESRYRQGLKTKSDYIRLQAQVLRSEQGIQEAQADSAQADSELRRVMGVPLGSSLKETIIPAVLEDETLPSVLPAPLSLEAQTLWKLSELDREIEEQNVRVTAREYGPRLYLNGGVEYLNDGYLDRSNPQVDGWGWSALATVRWNLWDWGVRDRQVSIARLTKEITESQINSSLQTRRSEVEKLMIEFKRTTDSLRLSRELLKLEKESYNLVESDYRNGRADYLQLITALSSLASARLTTISTVTSFRKSLFRYQYYQGTLHGSLAQN